MTRILVTTTFRGRVTSRTEYGSWSEAKRAARAIHDCYAKTFAPVITRDVTALSGAAHICRTAPNDDYWIQVRYTRGELI
jgi:hypothetical protein